MKNTFGESVSVTLFGESHGPAVGAVLDGMAPGIPVDPEFIDRQMSYRKSVSSLSTARKEPDTVKVISGVFEGKTTGTPIVFLIENSDTRSADYDSIKTVARPGHADYTAYCKYHGNSDPRLSRRSGRSRYGKTFPGHGECNPGGRRNKDLLYGISRNQSRFLDTDLCGS